MLTFGLIALPLGEDGGFVADAATQLWSTPWIDSARLTIADFDADGYDDIAVLYGALEGMALVWGDRHRTSEVTTVPVPVFAESSIASGDLDDDGTAELVVGTTQAVIAIAFTGRESGDPQTLLDVSGAAGLIVADLDGFG